jgi:ribosome-binding ATPase YchF (GTP1/OBG family)
MSTKTRSADLDGNNLVKAVRELADREAAECVVICAQLEAELVALPPEERLDYLKSLKVSTSGCRSTDQERLSPARVDVVSNGRRERGARLDDPARHARANRAGTIHSGHRARLHQRGSRSAIEELMAAGSYANCT